MTLFLPPDMGITFVVQEEAAERGDLYMPSSSPIAYRCCIMFASLCTKDRLLTLIQIPSILLAALGILPIKIMRLCLESNNSAPMSGSMLLCRFKL
ncbi:uncharacterized protein RAG0_03132 [Rhynchosporium agropyri]|uniref:Uncharacterized protein n=1 Tax=Rhynchosporium agropyri TaxID=914238 RepID=A0A1E1K323_9HELO|nr:uncharacterized protein RAG0_03132 [Rhynchosporium agropyri]